MTKAILHGWFAAMFVVVFNHNAQAANDEFYKGKTIRILIGASAGGAFDTWGRMTGRHLGKHIPGNPVIVAENVTGAGGLILANQAYKSTRPDGLTIATFNGGLLMGQMLGRPGIEFDARKFEYLGVPTKFDSVCAFSKASGITSFERWKGAKTPVKVGGTAPGSNLVDIPKVLMAVFGLPTQIIIGYKGFAEVRLAVDSGELAGACGGWDGLKLLWQTDRSGRRGGDHADAKAATGRSAERALRHGLGDSGRRSPIDRSRYSVPDAA